MENREVFEDKVYERSRDLNLAVTTMFAKAIVSYRGVAFRVTNVDAGDFITMDDESFLRLKRKLEHSAFKNDIELPEEAQNLKIIVPDKIGCALDDLNIMACQNKKCGYFWKLDSFRGYGHECPICKGHAVRNAIVFVGKLMTTGAVRKAPRSEHETILPLTRSLNRKCNKCGNAFTEIISTSAEEPIRSLKFRCRKCHTLQDIFAPRRGQYRYRPMYPSQSLVNSINASIAQPREEIGKVPKEIWEGTLPGINSFEFRKLDVYKVTFGYEIQKEKYNFESADPDIRKAYGRKFITNGFVLKINPQIFEECKRMAELKNIEMLISDPQRLKKVVLHTLKHSILAFMPIYTGLEAQKFGGGYDFTDNSAEVFFYDSEIGGNGGCQALFEDQDRLKKVLTDAKSRIMECSRGNDVCSGHCKLCIYIENCGEINLDLNRYVTQPLFGI